MQNIVEFPGLGLEFTLKNSLLLGPITLSYYGMIIAFGLLLGLIYAFRNLKKVGVDPDKAIDCILGGIIGGIVGARLYYVAFSWSDYGIDFSSFTAFWDTFSRIFKTWEGGMAIYGGLIGSLLVGVLIAKWRKVNINALLDIMGIGFLIGQGVGRWGNFFNVEAFGSNTTLPWGMSGPSIVNYLSSKREYLASVGVTVDPNSPVHPTFLYESLWCLLGFVLLAVYLKHRKFDGEVFLMYLAYYGAGRFIIEGLRT
ncbi:MAG: prolipoprotein diacylglyceryl transferase, partial [Oscillospiraceae bacterium]